MQTAGVEGSNRRLLNEWTTDLLPETAVTDNEANEANKANDTIIRQQEDGACETWSLAVPWGPEVLHNQHCNCHSVKLHFVV